MSRHRKPNPPDRPRRFKPADIAAWIVMALFLAALLPLFVVHLQATALLP